MRRRGIAAAACLAAILLGSSIALGGTKEKGDERTTLPPPIDEVVPPLGTPDEAVSALKRLRLHPGRDSLEPTEAVRNRPPGTAEERAR